MWSNYAPESLETDPLPDLSHLSLNTSPVKHPRKQDMPLIPPQFGVPTLSLLPPPRRVETLDGDPSDSRGRGRLKYNWRLQTFKNKARDDTELKASGADEKGEDLAEDGETRGLRLRHWTRVPATSPKDEGEETAEDTEVYPFARYTLQSLVYSYSDQEYADHINDPDSGWSKEETDYLFDLVKAYTARFYIILDRYEYPGTPENPPQKREIEDLKDRYYSIVRRLIKSRAGSDPEAIKTSDSLVLRYGFNREQEKARREHVAALWARAPAQVAEETHLYTELLRLSQTAPEFTAQRHHLLRLLAGIESGLPDIRTRDDRLAPLNQDPQIRGFKGAQWGVPNSAGPGGSAARKRRGGVAGGQSVDWDSPIHNNVISLGSASAQRQLLPPAQQEEYDARHHIYRAPPGSTLINPKNTHTPVHTRSSKFPVPKPVLASYIQGYSQAAADATGTGSPSGPSLFTRIDVHTNKLAMPTKENIEWMERVFAIASQFVEVQRAIERVDAELATQRTRLGLPPGGGEKGGERKKEEQTQGTERSVPAAASTASGTESRPLRSSSRKRTMSVSSEDTASTTHKRMKT